MLLLVIKKSLPGGVCWKRFENGQDKLPLVDFSSSPAITQVGAPKITLPTEKHDEIEMGEAFLFKTSRSVLIVGPSAARRLVSPNRYSWITWKNCL